MKFLHLFKFYILLYFMIAVSASAAPAPGVIVTPENIEKTSKEYFSLLTTIRFDHQKNIFKKQVAQFPYKEADSDEDPRHYSKTRSSENSTDFIEFETGTYLFETTYIYAKAGAGRFYSDLKVLDETVKGLFQSPDLFKITDNDAFMYGYGLSFKIFENDLKKFLKKVRINLNIDYKKLYVDVKDHGTEKISYKADIDEINTSILFTGLFENKKIFFGPRISNITGSDSLKVESAGFNYSDSIKTFKNMGWLFGVTFFKNDFYSLTLQKRFGDEEGISFETTFNF